MDMNTVIEYLKVMSDTLKEIVGFLSGEEPASPTETASPTEPAEQRALTLEEVRAELSKFSRAGKSAVVKSILGKFGVKKLSEVDPKDYWAIMAMAQEAENA